jgi:hypothetical protein
MTRRPETPRDVALEILDYFLRNANAADDLEGVASFRLLDQAIYRQVAEVSEALEWLVSVGWLTKTTHASASPIFRLNKAKRDEAQAFVANATSAHKPRRKREGNGSPGRGTP